MTPKISPRRTVRETSSTACTACSPSPKVLLTWRSSIAGCASPPGSRGASVTSGSSRRRPARGAGRLAPSGCRSVSRSPAIVLPPGRRRAGAGAACAPTPAACGSGVADVGLDAGEDLLELGGRVLLDDRGAARGLLLGLDDLRGVRDLGELEQRLVVLVLGARDPHVDVGLRGVGVGVVLEQRLLGLEARVLDEVVVDDGGVDRLELDRGLLRGDRGDGDLRAREHVELRGDRAAAVLEL